MHKQIRLPVLINSSDVLTQEYNMIGADRFFAERHSGIIGSEIAFFVIASQTSRDEILPGIFTTAGFGMDVIDGQPGSGTAILAGMSVAAQNIFARENYFLEWHSDKMRKSYDAWEIHRRMCRAKYFIRCHADDFGFAHEDQDDRFLNAANGQWFIVTIKE